MRDVGKNIKSLRMQKNMTQDELAQCLFVTRQTVSNYENGNSRPDVDMLLKIAEVFAVDVNVVLYGYQITPEQKKKRQRAVILFVVTLLLGVVLMAVAGVVGGHLERYASLHYVYYYSARLLWRNWLKPIWLLMMGWATIHGLCVFCGTKTLRPPVSRYIKWGILTLVIAYIVLILPYSVWFLWNDLQILYRHNNGIAGEYSSHFSVFPVWDQLAYLVMQFVKPQNALQAVLAGFSYLSLPFGALLRLCKKPVKE